MVGTLTNILITLMGICTVVGIAHFYWPQIERILEEKLKLSLNREASDKSNQPLKQIFYKFNHDTSDAWINWITTQDEMTKDRAFAKLIDHLEGSPKEWGSATAEAAKAVPHFEYEESFEILIDFLESGRKMWARYKSIKPSYEEATKGIIHINPYDAKDAIYNELRSPCDKDVKDKIARSIINSLESFPEGCNIDDLYIYILTNKNLGTKTREHAIVAIIDRFEDEAENIFTGAIKEFTNESFGVIEGDNAKIYSRLVHESTKTIDKKTFDLLYAACHSDNASSATIKALGEIIPIKDIDFDPEYLLEIYKIKHKKNKVLRAALAKRHSLTSSETSIINEINLIESYPFKHKALSKESQSKEIKMPSCIKKTFDEINEALAKRATVNEKGENIQGGGVLIGGNGSLEKLYIARSIASQRKWSFIYAGCKELLDDHELIGDLSETINAAKPCLLYISNAEAVVQSDENCPLFRLLKQFAVDPMIFLAGSVEDEVVFDIENNLPAPLSKLDRDIFPLIRNLSAYDDNERIKILDEFIGKLSPSRTDGSFNHSEVVEHSRGMSGIELICFILDYFKTSLLAYGKLVPLMEYKTIK